MAAEVSCENSLAAARRHVLSGVSDGTSVDPSTVQVGDSDLAGQWRKRRGGGGGKWIAFRGRHARLSTGRRECRPFGATRTDGATGGAWGSGVDPSNARANLLAGAGGMQLQLGTCVSQGMQPARVGPQTAAIEKVGREHVSVSEHPHVAAGSKSRAAAPTGSRPLKGNPSQPSIFGSPSFFHDSNV